MAYISSNIVVCSNNYFLFFYELLGKHDLRLMAKMHLVRSNTVNTVAHFLFNFVFMTKIVVKKMHFPFIL